MKIIDLDAPDKLPKLIDINNFSCDRRVYDVIRTNTEKLLIYYLENLARVKEKWYNYSLSHFGNTEPIPKIYDKSDICYQEQIDILQKIITNNIYKNTCERDGCLYCCYNKNY